VYAETRTFINLITRAHNEKERYLNYLFIFNIPQFIKQSSICHQVLLTDRYFRWVVLRIAKAPNARKKEGRILRVGQSIFHEETLSIVPTGSNAAQKDDPLYRSRCELVESDFARRTPNWGNAWLIGHRVISGNAVV